MPPIAHQSGGWWWNGSGGGGMEGMRGIHEVNPCVDAYLNTTVLFHCNLVKY